MPRKHLKVVSKPLMTEKEFEVEKILDHRWENNEYQYLTKWRGYSDSENSWEPQGNFSGTQAITQYWRNQTSRRGSHLEGSDVEHST